MGNGQVAANFKLQLMSCVKFNNEYCVYQKAAMYITRTCDAMLHNITLIAELKKHQFDLVIVNRFICGSCMFLIPHVLGVPYVGFGGLLLPWTGGSVSLPSFVPVTTFVQFSDSMSFYERLLNTLIHIVLATEYIFPGNNNHTLLQEFAPEITSWMDLVQKAHIQFTSRDGLLEWVGPLAPNIISLPGITAKPAKSLTADLEILTDKSTGLIIVSFGSHFSEFPVELANKFLTAFSQFKETIFWRMENLDNLKIPKNVHILKWLPQNDMLGHRKTKLFLTHCGNNGQYEAVYHGVPMLGFPMFGDQHHNAFRMVQHGIGIRLNPNTFTVSELVANINILLSNSTHRQKIRHKSRIIQASMSRMTHIETVNYWIEHILKHGSDHLKPSAISMPWYQLLMLDMAGILLILFVIPVCLILAKIQFIRFV